MKVLVAGYGYVGSKLAQDLVAAGDDVYAVRQSQQAEWGAGVTGIALDLVNGDLSALPTKLNRIYFCAAPGGSTAAAYEEVYGKALGRVQEFLRRTGDKGARLVVTSSTSVYGQHDGELVDEASETSPAAATSAWIVKAEQNLDEGDVAVRLGGIYGPGRTSFIAAVTNGSLAVNPQRSAFTNRIHRDDAAGVMRFCGGLEAPERIYNGVDCETATRATVAAWIADQVGVALKTVDAAEESSFLRGNKRVSNQRLLAAGYKFLYPTFREGYAALMRSALS